MSSNQKATPTTSHICCVTLIGRKVLHWNVLPNASSEIERRIVTAQLLALFSTVSCLVNFTEHIGYKSSIAYLPQYLICFFCGFPISINKLWLKVTIKLGMSRLDKLFQ